MRGLEIARKFYEECRPSLYAQMPEIMEQACAGLCGEGSECFGCDDETSRDHDFAALFCLWLPDETLLQHGQLVESAFNNLPESFLGAPSGIGLPLQGRRGPRGIENYFLFFTGLDHPPRHWREWLAIPEFQLAAAVNGEVFEDNAGIFTAWRNALLAGYPDDVRLKKLAARCMQMAQSGQYNFPRCLGRKEYGGAMLALNRFMEAAIAFVFLANRRYMPFYKWAPRLGQQLPVLGKELKRLLEILTSRPVHGEGNQELVNAIEEFCSACARWLNDNHLSNVQDAWLWLHGPEIIERVKIPELQAMDLLKESA